MAHPEIAAAELAEPDTRPHRHQSGRKWLAPAVTALGVVYGDIGTSPLYAFQLALGATGHAVPTRVDVLGLVSLILWAVLLVVAVKYVTVVMRADNRGKVGFWRCFRSS